MLQVQIIFPIWHNMCSNNNTELLFLAGLRHLFSDPLSSLCVWISLVCTQRPNFLVSALYNMLVYIWRHREAVLFSLFFSSQF